MVNSLRTVRKMELGRLVYYRKKASPAFWDSHWKTYGHEGAYAAAEEGRLAPFLEKPLITHLAREGRVLEAGCGNGHIVLALRKRGYDVEGVEWAPETVAKVHGKYPDLPIRVGDVTSLSVPDGHYSGYISLGVVEHRQEGPEPFLAEAFRVLKPGGTALISVPFLHSLRRWKARLNLYRGDVGGLEFYQYAFKEDDFQSLLQSAGLHVVDRYAYDAFKGLKDEIPPLRLAQRWQVVSRGAGLLIRQSRYLEDHFGHMILFVCQKEG